jgi:hypothetical protein
MAAYPNATEETLRRDAAAQDFHDARHAYNADRGPEDDARHQQLSDALDDARKNPALPWYLR